MSANLINGAESLSMTGKNMVDDYDLLVHIEHHVAIHGGKLVLLHIPRIRDLAQDSLTPLQRAMQLMCTELSYKFGILCENDTPLFGEKFLPMTTAEKGKLIIDNLDVFADCFYGIDDFETDPVGVVNRLVTNREGLEPVYVNEIYKFPETNLSGCHINANGERLTVGQPEHPTKRVFMIGDSTIFGFRVDDQHTIASKLQALINNKKLPIAVVNFGVNANTMANIYAQVMKLDVQRGDIVIVNYIPRNEPEFVQFPIIKLGNALEKASQEHETYLDAHLTPWGSAVAAEQIMNCLFPESRTHIAVLENIDSIEKQEFMYTGDKALDDKLKSWCENNAPILNYDFVKVKNMAQDDPARPLICGLMMSCNPFTFGHKHLISIASAMFDYVVVFLMDGAKYLYDPNVHVEMIKVGTQDMPNVNVIHVPSFYSLADYFPQYNDYALRNQKNYIAVNTYAANFCSIKLFKCFGCNYRMVGEEPNDAVTRQANDQEVLLAEHGIKQIVIPRKKVQNDLNENRAISGTMCRQLIENGNYDALRELIPSEVLQYLKENNFPLRQYDMQPRNVDKVANVTTKSAAKIADLIIQVEKKKQYDRLNIPVVPSDKAYDYAQHLIDMIKQ